MSEQGERRRTGRRPGESGTRDLVLSAARTNFAEAGYDATTIRGVAARAGVDPALVHYFFGTKRKLFAAAMNLPVDPSTIAARAIAEGTDGIGERLARAAIAFWDASETGGPLIALLRSAASHEESATLLREFFAAEVISRIAGALDAPDAELRAALVATQIMGCALSRYILHVEPVASVDVETLASYLGPILQRYLTGDLTNS